MWPPGYSGHDSILQVFIIVAFDIKELVVQLHEATFQHGPRAIQKVKNVYAHSLRTCFVAADHWFLKISDMLKSCLMQLYDKCLNVIDNYDENLKDAVAIWLNSQAATWYDESIHKLVPRYVKCLNVKGDYVEK